MYKTVHQTTKPYTRVYKVLNTYNTPIIHIIILLENKIVDFRHYPRKCVEKFILPHKRKPEKIKQRKQKFLAKKLVWKYSYKDIKLSETVCRSSTNDLIPILEKEFGFVNMSELPPVFKGLIISDSRGEGIFNK